MEWLGLFYLGCFAVVLEYLHRAWARAPDDDTLSIGEMRPPIGPRRTPHA